MKLFINNRSRSLMTFDTDYRTHSIRSHDTVMVLDTEQHIVERVLHRAKFHGLISTKEAAAINDYTRPCYRTEPVLSADA